MKNPLSLLLALSWALASLALPAPARAQEAVTGAPSAATPDDATVITADSFRLDQGTRQGVFTGSVVVSSKNFRMQSRELTVFFGSGAPAAGTGGTVAAGSNKVQRLLARGDVVIVSQDRNASAVQADYDVASDKMVLTGAPQITQGKDTITGTTITLFRSSSKMEVDGRSRVVLNGGFPAPDAPAKP